jgi:hypothetical protein
MKREGEGMTKNAENLFKHTFLATCRKKWSNFVSSTGQRKYHYEFVYSSVVT